MIKSSGRPLAPEEIEFSPAALIKMPGDGSFILLHASYAHVVVITVRARYAPEWGSDVYRERVMAHAAPAATPYYPELLPVILVVVFVAGVLFIPVRRPFLGVAGHVEGPVRARPSRESTHRGGAGVLPKRVYLCI